MMQARKLFRARSCRWPLSLAASSSPLPLRQHIASPRSKPSFSPASIKSSNYIESNRLRMLGFRGFSSEPCVASEPGLIDVPLAQTGEGIAECELLKWFVQEDEEIEEFQPLCQVQSDKATIDITSRYKGRISKILHVPGDIIKVGETLVQLAVESSEEEKEEPISNPNNSPSLDDKQEPTINPPIKPQIETDSPNLTTPAVRNLAKQHNVDLSSISGTGKGGRITKEDILYHNKNPFQKEDETTVPLRGYQRAMVKTMTAAARIPHFYYVEEMNCTALTALKTSIQEAITDPSLKCTFLPILIKSLSNALKGFPFMNSSFNEDAVEVTVKRSHNIGVAMATPGGLVVPNIKNVESLSIMEVIKELSRLQSLASAGNLGSEEVSGGTITVSNIGAIGGQLGMPLVNLPESVIIAVGRIKRVPAFDEFGGVVGNSVMNVTVGADHRVIDGATVAMFCNEWKRMIERPGSLLLNMR